MACLVVSPPEVPATTSGGAAWMQPPGSASRGCRKIQVPVDSRRCSGLDDSGGFTPSAASAAAAQDTVSPSSSWSVNPSSPSTRKLGRDSPGMNHVRAANILRQFDFYKEMDPRLQQKLPIIATGHTYPKNTVLFRQGDPPGSCYVILNGEVGIFVLSDDEASNENDDLTPINSQRKRDADKETEQRGNLEVSRQRRLALTANYHHNTTAEGYSFYVEGSNIGKQVASFGPGKIFGELALLHNDQRLATVKCLEETEFLIMNKQDFQEVMKEELIRTKQEKTQFLWQHVPGMKELTTTPGKPDASYFFNQASYPKGYTFFRQGKVADESFFLVVKGSVEFHHLPARDGGGVRAGNPQSADATVRGLLRQCHSSSSPTRSPVGAAHVSAMRHSGTLVPGGVFGSLPTPGTPEPFTVMASTPVVVMHVTRDGLAKLPRKLVQHVREYLIRATIWRLENLQQHLYLKLPQQGMHGTPPNSASGNGNRPGKSTARQMSAPEVLHLPPATPGSRPMSTGTLTRSMSSGMGALSRSPRPLSSVASRGAWQPKTTLSLSASSLSLASAASKPVQPRPVATPLSFASDGRCSLAGSGGRLMEPARCTP